MNQHAGTHSSSSSDRVATPGPGALSTMRLPNRSVVMQLNPAETSLQYREIVVGRDYLHHGVTLHTGATVLDVGANIGISALAFHWECADVRVFAFEPTQPLYDALVWNFRTHGLRGRTYHCGLSRESGEATISLYPETTAMSSLYADVGHDTAVTRTFLGNSGFTDADTEDMVAGRYVINEQICELRTVSQIIDEEQIDVVDLFKINVEKAEADVLAGVRNEHWPRIRQIAMQVHDIDDRLAAVRAELDARGFAVTHLQDPLLDGTDIHDLVAIRH